MIVGLRGRGSEDDWSAREVRQGSENAFRFLAAPFLGRRYCPASNGRVLEVFSFGPGLLEGSRRSAGRPC